MAKFKDSLSFEEVSKLLYIDHEIWDLRWKVKRNGTKGVNSIAGCIDPEGHKRVKIKGKLYPTSNLIWFLYYGVWHDKVIDHFDRNPLNNDIKNLRITSDALNSQNRGIRKDNSSGMPGVCYSKRDEKWTAYIMFYGKRIWLGTFQNKRDAMGNRMWAYLKYFPTADHREVLREYLS